MINFSVKFETCNIFQQNYAKVFNLYISSKLTNENKKPYMFNSEEMKKNETFVVNSIIRKHTILLL